MEASIPVSKIVETAMYYLGVAYYYTGSSYDSWAALGQAEALSSLLPFGSPEREGFDREYTVVHNELRAEADKEFARGHEVSRPKKSLGKGNRTIVRQMLKRLSER